MKHKRCVLARVTIYVDDDTHCGAGCDYERHGLCNLYRSGTGFRKLRFDPDGRMFRCKECIADEETAQREEKPCPSM